MGNFTTDGSVTQSSYVASAATDYTTVLCIPASCPAVVAGEFPLASRTDMNFASVVTLLPGAATIAPSPPLAGAGDPVLGEVVGDLASETSLGLSNLSCDGYLPVTFNFMVASADNAAGNLVYPSPQNEAVATAGAPGTPFEATGTLMPLLSDSYAITAGNGGAPDGGAGLLSSAAPPVNGIAVHVEKYPSYLNTLFSSVAPMARYSGGQIVANSAVILTYLIFAPGALAAVPAPDPLYDLAEVSLGYSFFSVLQDPTADPAPSSISDFCGPLSVTFNIYGRARANGCLGTALAPCATANGINNPVVGVPSGEAQCQVGEPLPLDDDGDTLVNDGCPTAGDLPTAFPESGIAGGCANAVDEADEDPGAPVDPDDDLINDGCPAGGPVGNLRYENPAAPGTHFFGALNTSLRDSDGDGYENALDTCQYAINVDNPRDQDGADDDMLDPICEPTRGAETGADCAAGEALPLDDDGDTLVNDGCPTVGTFPESGVGGCANLIDEADEDPGAPVTDDDTAINDGCPTLFGDLETDCAAGEGLPLDDDGDTYVNDGCVTAGTFPESGVAGCANAIDEADEDPGPPVTGDDTAINDGCPGVNVIEEDDKDGDLASNGGVWQNAGDNCPQIANPTQTESERPEPPLIGQPRGGSKADTLGDLCDLAEVDCALGEALPLDDDGDGLVNDGCIAVGAPEVGCLNVADDEDNPNTAANEGDGVNDGCPSSSRVGNGHFHSTFELLPVCILGAGVVGDVDGDGWCNLVDGTNGLDDPDDTMATLTPEHWATQRVFPVLSSGSGASPPASGEPRQPCNDGLNNDGAGGIDALETDGPDAGTVTDCNPASCPGAPTCILTSPDTDGDGSPDGVEVYLGTDPLGRCERGSSAAPGIPSSDWPMDLGANGTFSADRINVSDLASYVAPIRYIGTSPGIVPFDKRWDIVPGTTFSTWINVQDLSFISQLAAIPMFGVRAFGGPTCTGSATLGD